MHYIVYKYIKHFSTVKRIKIKFIKCFHESFYFYVVLHHEHSVEYTDILNGLGHSILKDIEKHFGVKKNLAKTILVKIVAM